MAESANVTGRANLYRSDGTRRPDREVLAESGKIGLRLALLDDAMHRLANSPVVDLHYPPRLFLSYKWGSEAQNAWVAELAQRLRQHGWDVVFDRWRDETVDRSVEEFVARLVSCRIFVAVLSPAYYTAAFEAAHPTWVFDEMQCALMARPRMRLAGILPPPGLAVGGKPGSTKQKAIRIPQVPAIVVQSMRTPEFDEVYEARDWDDLEGFLDRSLTYQGSRLEEAEREWVAERLAREEDESSLREIIERYPFVSGAWRRLVVLLRDRGELQAALEAAKRALEFVQEPSEALTFQHERIELLKRSSDRTGAAQAATQLIDQRPHDWVAHYHLGDLLDDAQDPWAARSHLLLACREAHSVAAPYNLLGVVYMGLGLLTRAVQALEQALRLDSTLTTARRNLDLVLADPDPLPQAGVTEVQGPLPGCTDCEAIFFPRADRPFNCAACGAAKSSSAAPCDVCGAVEIAPIIKVGDSYIEVRCPICRTGTITSKDRARL